MDGWMDGWVIQALLLAIAILLVTFLLCALASPVTKDIASGFPCLAETLGFREKRAKTCQEQANFHKPGSQL